MATFRCKVPIPHAPGGLTAVRFGIPLLFWAWIAIASPPQPIHWRRVNAETLRHFKALLRIDTSNPPGNETEAARYLAGVLERERIPVKLLALEQQHYHEASRHDLLVI